MIDLKKNGWTKRELTQDLANFYYNDHLITESIDKLWQNQMSNKSKDELEVYLDKLYKQLSNYNDKNNEIKSRKFYNLLDKINYLEDILGTKPKIGRVLK